MPTMAPTRPPGAARYLPELDLLRGAAIVAVVYLHAYFSPWEVTPERDKAAMHLIHLFAHSAVPMFLFISGLLMARERQTAFGQFARKKWLRLGIPFVGWMAVAFVYRAWRTDAWADTTLWKDAALLNVSGQFYYLWVLAVCYVAFFPALWLSTRWLGWLAVGAFAANLATIAAYQSSTISGDFATLAYRNPFTWVAFFAVGLYAGRRSDSLAWARRWTAPALAAMAVLLVVYMARGEAKTYPVSYFSVVVFLFSCLALVAWSGMASALMASRVRAAAAPVRALGRYSFAIYLVHMPLFIGFVTEELVSGSSLQNDYWRLMHGIFAVGFVTSLAFVVLAGWLFPGPAQLLLGIEGRGRRARGASPSASTPGPQTPAPPQPATR
jgi:peptidoglycan/LPS O-acetylase OafA/YrhL